MLEYISKYAGSEMDERWDKAHDHTNKGALDLIPSNLKTASYCQVFYNDAAGSEAYPEINLSDEFSVNVGNGFNVSQYGIQPSGAKNIIVSGLFYAANAIVLFEQSGSAPILTKEFSGGSSGYVIIPPTIIKASGQTIGVRAYMADIKDGISFLLMQDISVF